MYFKVIHRLQVFSTVTSTLRSPSSIAELLVYAICKVTTSDQATGELGKGLNLTTCLQARSLCDFNKTNRYHHQIHLESILSTKLSTIVKIYQNLQICMPLLNKFRANYVDLHIGKGILIVGRGTGASTHPIPITS